MWFFISVVLIIQFYGFFCNKNLIIPNVNINKQNKILRKSYNTTWCNRYIKYIRSSNKKIYPIPPSRAREANRVLVKIRIVLNKPPNPKM